MNVVYNTPYRGGASRKNLWQLAQDLLALRVRRLRALRLHSQARDLPCPAGGLRDREAHPHEHSERPRVRVARTGRVDDRLLREWHGGDVRRALALEQLDLELVYLLLAPGAEQVDQRLVVNLEEGCGDGEGRRLRSAVPSR